MDTDLLCQFTVKDAKYKYINANCGFFRRGGISTFGVKRRKHERKLIMKRYGASDSAIFLTQCYHTIMQLAKSVLLRLNFDPTKIKEKIKFSKL